MGKEKDACWGAAVERGKIAQAADGGYIVESYDRPGIETPPITGLNNEIYSAGDRVFFFLFDDGSGRILGKL